MIHELLLAVTLQTSACSNPSPVTSTSATTAVYSVPLGIRQRVCTDNEDGFHRGGCRYVVYSCLPYMQTTFYRIAEFPDYMACMQRVAIIGEDEHVRGVCREKR